MLVQAALLALFALDTRPLETNGGLGYDGVEYAAAVSWLRGADGAAPSAPYSYRLLAPAIVAASGLDVRLGFFALNVAAILASSLVLLAMMRREGATPARALLLVAWFALLPTGMRYALVYPVLVDGLGLLIFVSLLAAAQARRAALFAALLVAGALTREQSVLLAPLAMSRGGPSAWARNAAIAAPAVAALALARIAPPYPTAGPGTLDFVLVNAWMLATNARGEALRLLAAPLLALGALVGVAAALRATVAATLGRDGWSYAAAVVVLTGALGGLDHDRYYLWLAPFVLVAAARVPWPLPLATLVTALHVVATRALVPVDGSGASYLSFALIAMPLGALALWTAVAALASAAVAFATRRASG